MGVWYWRLVHRVIVSAVVSSFLYMDIGGVRWDSVYRQVELYLDAKNNETSKDVCWHISCIWQAKVDKTLNFECFHILKCFQVQFILTHQAKPAYACVCGHMVADVCACSFIYPHVLSVSCAFNFQSISCATLPKIPLSMPTQLVLMLPHSRTSSWQCSTKNISKLKHQSCVRRHVLIYIPSYLHIPMQADLTWDRLNSKTHENLTSQEFCSG